MLARRGVFTALAAICALVVCVVFMLTASEADAKGRVRDESFNIKCTLEQRANVDPIVSFGTTSAHRHDIFGPKDGLKTTTTPEQLLGMPNSCEFGGVPRADAQDHSAYWQPTVYVDGKVVRNDPSTAYYNLPDDVDPREVQPMPFGLKVVAGDAHAETPPEDVVIWRCNGAGPVGAVPKKCPEGTHVAAYIRFPNCWDGFRLDSPDHQSHMAYSVNGHCPASHPVMLPRLQLNPSWETRAGNRLQLSSGPPATMHADFMNAWKPQMMEFLVRECMNDGTGCRNHPPI